MESEPNEGIPQNGTHAAVTTVTDHIADYFLWSLKMNSEGEPYSEAIQMVPRLEHHTLSARKLILAGVIKVIALTLALAVGSWAAGQGVTEKCGPHPNLLRNESGSLVWFSSTNFTTWP